jgi:hypothetical protein
MAAVEFDTLKSLNFSAISAAYAALGSVVGHNWRIVKIINNTDGDLIVSTDDTNASGEDFIPAYSFVLYDFATNNDPDIPTDILVVAKNTQFYIKQSTAPSKGDVWLSAVYAKGQ